jgi:hypothetical protein
MARRPRASRLPETMVAGMDLPTPFELALFLQQLGERRGRPIIVVDEPTLAEMPEDNICGLWVEFTDVDQLYVRAGLAPLHREAAVLHEVGHMMLDHVTGDDAEGYSGLVPALAASGALNVHRTRARSQYEDPLERDAERFARAVLARAGRYIPPAQIAQPTAPRDVVNMLNRMAKMYTPQGGQ